MEETEEQLPTWFADTFESLGSQFIKKDGKVAADTPWGAGYVPTRYADMNATEREQADGLYKRWDEDDNFVSTRAANGTTIYTDKTSGFSANSDQLMLTAGANGQYEVASMFDIGMMTGAVSEAKTEMDITRSMLGLDNSKEPEMTANPNDPAATSKGLATEDATSEEQATGQAMLETDQSGATPPTTQQPGAPVAGPVTEEAMPQTEDFSYKTATGETAKVTSEDYNIEGITSELSAMPSRVEKALASQGIDKNNANYDKYFQQVQDKFVGQTVDKHKIAATPTPPTTETPSPAEPSAEGPEEKVSTSSEAVHWMDRGEKAALNKSGKTDDYERRYTNKYNDDQNIGNYTSSADWETSFDRTIAALKEGKLTAKEDQLMSKMNSNKQKYHDLGIASMSDIAAYEKQRTNHFAKEKSASTSSGLKLQREKRHEQTMMEASDTLDNVLDADVSKKAIDNIKLTRKQAKAFRSARGELPKREADELRLRTDSASRLSHMQNLLKDADVEKLEYVKPLDRAKQFVSRYFGGTDTEDKTTLLQMSKDEMVSRVVKEISGAAASDQERAFIQKWLLGGKGLSAKTFKKVLNNIQYKDYEKATSFGERLYIDNRLGALQQLKDATGSISDIKYEDLDEQIKAELKGAK